MCLQKLPKMLKKIPTKTTTKKHSLNRAGLTHFLVSVCSFAILSTNFISIIHFWKLGDRKQLESGKKQPKTPKQQMISNILVFVDCQWTSPANEKKKFILHYFYLLHCYGNSPFVMSQRAQVPCRGCKKKKQKKNLVATLFLFLFKMWKTQHSSSVLTPFSRRL